MPNKIKRQFDMERRISTNPLILFAPKPQIKLYKATGFPNKNNYFIVQFPQNRTCTSYLSLFLCCRYSAM